MLVWVMSALPLGSEEIPNVVLIFADDLGWRDLGCYGHPVHETPNLDALAARGLKFTQAYASAPICSASRAALLTGKSTARLRFEFVVKGEPGRQTIPRVPLRSPPYVLDLPLEESTIGECLGGDGTYETAFFGKWHLNQHYQRYLGWSPTHGPQKQGFVNAEEDFGSHPYSYWNRKEKRTFDESVGSGDFTVDGMIERANAFIRKPHDKPFFLMISHFFVHDPNHTRLKWLYDKYGNKIAKDDSRRGAKAHFAAMVETLDHLVGRTLKALDESGQAENTLVLFTSDNGGHPNYAGNAPLRGSKWNLYEGGVRVPMIARWPGKTKQGSVCDAPVIGYDIFPTLAELGGKNPSNDLDGVSFADLLLDPEKSKPERALYWHFPYYHPERDFGKSPVEIGIDDGITSQTRPHSAVRFGSKTLLYFHEDKSIEMYDVVEDIGQAIDLSEREPYEANLRLKMLLDYLKGVNARMPASD